MTVNAPPRQPSAGTRLSPLLWLPLMAFMLVWGTLLVGALAHVGQPFAGFHVDRTGMVWITNEPYMAGLRAGLRPGDSVRRLDGRPVSSGALLRETVRQQAPGSPVGYEVEREGTIRTVTVEVQRLAPVDFAMSFGLRFLLALVLALIGAMAAFMRPANRAAQANFGFCLGWGLYLVLDIDFQLMYMTPAVAYYGSVMLYAAAALSMVLNFPETPAWLAERPKRQWLPYVGGALLLVPVAGGFWAWGMSEAAIALGEVVSSAWANGVLLAGMGVFVLRLRRAGTARTRAQIQVLFLGVALAFLPMALLVNIPGLFGQTPSALAFGLGQVAFVLFPLSLAYAILKHGLFDIQIIIKRTTVYASLTAFLVGGYFAVAATLRFLANVVLGASQASDWENVIATGVIAVAFVPVRQAVTNAVDKLFFRTKYDFRAVVARITEKAQTSLDITGMKREFMEAIDEALHPRYLYILSMVPQGDVLTTVGTMAVWGDAPMPELKVFIDDPLLLREGREREVQYVPVTGLTGMLSPLAALGPHYRVPLKVGEEVVGLVVLGPKRSDEEYSAEDRELLAATRLPLANAIKTAALLDDRLFKDRMEQELKRAREVQEAMLPRALPELPGYQFAASSEACFEASGDYYDFIALPDGRLGIAVADVAGKGIAAALATAMAKSGLYNQTQTNPEVLPVLTALNRLIHSVSKHAAAKSFTTMIYALLDPESRRLTFACAGHFPPHHYDASADAITEFPLAGGFPLGVRDNSKYVSREIALSAGDVLVFYTDGVTEAQAPDEPAAGLEPGECFESERLGEVILANKHRSAAEIHQAIKEAVDAHVAGGPQTDDITIVVIKVL